MKKKIVVLLMATAFSLSTFGCGKDTEPVTSESVIETEEQEVEPDEETAKPEENAVNAIDGLNEGTTINRDTGLADKDTTAIDSNIPANPNGGSDVAPPPEGGEDIAPPSGETYTDELGREVEVVGHGEFNEETSTVELNGETYTVIGKKGDLSWRRMTDEEAHAIYDKGDPTKRGEGNYTWDEVEQYRAAEAELDGAQGYWFEIKGAKLMFVSYYDYMDYIEEESEQFRSENDLGRDATPEEEEWIRSWQYYYCRCRLNYQSASTII